VLRDEQPVGEVTSGTFSPTLRHGIAMAYVLRDAAAQDTELQVDVRGRRGAARVTRPPFVDASPK
jgi:aminomethyltransferase